MLWSRVHRVISGAWTIPLRRSVWLIQKHENLCGLHGMVLNVYFHTNQQLSS